MKHTASFILFLLSWGLSLGAEERPIDCRLIVGGMRECIPYSPTFLRTKQVKYQKDQKKLIVEKTLPVPSEPFHLKFIPMAELIERYVKVEDSKRFKGTLDEDYFDVSLFEKESSGTTKQEETKEGNRTKPSDKERVQQGIYIVRKGDTISKIAYMFGVKSKEIIKLNNITKKNRLKIGQKLKVPIAQEMIDAIVSASYMIKPGDTLIRIAKKFHLDPKELARYNHLKSTSQIRAGKVLRLPLPYVKAAEKRAREKRLAEAKKRKETYASKFIRRTGKHRLRVTATAYTSHHKQTDKTPFLAAWNNRLRPGMKAIAVSRDLLYKYGMKNGTRVKISGLPGYYRVRDKMNKRYKRRIDIYMGTNRRKALKWGRRSVVIYW